MAEKTQVTGSFDRLVSEVFGSLTAAEHAEVCRMKMVRKAQVEYAGGAADSAFRMLERARTERNVRSMT